MYKVVAVDLDGTLLTSKVTTTLRAKAALQRVLAAGSHVVLTTGRTPYRAQDFYQELDLRGPTVTYNGALVVDFERGKTVYGQPLEGGGLLEQVLRDAIAWGALGYYLEGSQGVIAYRNDEVTRNRFANHRVKPFAYGTPAEHPEHLCYKVFMYCDEAVGEELNGRLVANYSELMTIKYYKRLGHSPGTSWFEFMAPGVSKAKGLASLLKEWQLGYEDVLFFGDEVNDLELMVKAGCGVAMGNGVEALKEVADRIALTNDEDGVARILEELF